MSQPLSGQLVVALEHAVAAPFCTARLADGGARVIKVEREDGDFARGYDEVVNGQSAYFVWLNRGKESLTLDIKEPTDSELLHRIIDEADVFVQNLAPGAASRAGLDSAELRRRNSRLITVDVSGYGEGPYHEMKAYDLLMQCESGLASITGGPSEPGRVGVSVCDIACGMYAHSAILEALLQREKTGLGCGLTVSLFDALADWMTVPLLHFLGSGSAPERVGLNHPSIAPYGVYSIAGDADVVIAVQSDREWAEFCDKVLLKPELADDPLYRSNMDRCQNRATMDLAIDAVFSRLNREQLTFRLNEARVAWGSVNSIADLARHPHLRKRQLATPGGKAEIVASPVVTTEREYPPGPVPALGEHSEAIRREFGA